MVSGEERVALVALRKGMVDLKTGYRCEEEEKV